MDEKTALKQSADKRYDAIKTPDLEEPPSEKHQLTQLELEVQDAARRIANALTDADTLILEQPIPYFAKSVLYYLRYFRAVAVCLMLFFTFFEKPWWCNEHPAKCAQDDIYLNSQIPYADPAHLFLGQMVCLGVLLFSLCWRQYFVKKTDYRRMVETVIVILSIADTFVAMVYLDYREDMFISPFLRPILFVFVFQSIRQTLWQIIKIIPIIFELLILLLILLIGFSWFGLILFYQQEEQDQISARYFDTYGHALLNLFIFMSTANSPDVRMPLYWRYRPYVTFFILFMITALYFILPFIFSAVYNNYKNIVMESEREYTAAKSQALIEAFHLLQGDEQEGISLRVCKDLLEELSKYHSKISMVMDDQAETLIESVDHERNGRISESEFVELCTKVIKLEIKRSKSSIPLDDSLEQRLLTRRFARCLQGFHLNYAKGAVYEKAKMIIRHRYFEYFINVMLVANGCFFAVQTRWYIQGQRYHDMHFFWREGDWFFTGMYTIEMALKIYVLGCYSYFKRPANVFDGVITIMTLCTSFLTYWDFVTERLVRVVLIARTLRLLRLFSNVRRFRIIFASFLKLIPAFATLLGVLLVQYFLFGLLGVRLFGGLLYVGNPTLAGSAYEAVQYFPNNFNDFGSAMVVLFDLMVINNWFIYMDAIALVSGEAYRIFFFVFWFFTNLLTLNLLVANILDVVSAQLDKAKKEDHDLQDL